jgi:hypothetical protein
MGLNPYAFINESFAAIFKDGVANGFTDKHIQVAKGLSKVIRSSPIPKRTDSGIGAVGMGSFGYIVGKYGS